MSSPLPAWGKVGFTLAASAMIATPLRPRGRRALLADVVVGGLAAATLAVASSRWGTRRAVVAAAVVTSTTTLLELAGSRLGVPFGRYRYGDALRPRVAGVPAAVPLAWWAMALPAREAGRLALGHPVLGGALALTAWDLFLDPQMVGEGYWRWDRGGAYVGVPLSNYAGWLVSSAALMGGLQHLLPPGREPELALAGLYAWMAVMQTLGFAVFFRAPKVAAAGGAAMLPMAALALAAARRSRRG